MLYEYGNLCGIERGGARPQLFYIAFENDSYKSLLITNPILTFFVVRTEKYWPAVICIGPSLRVLMRYDHGTIFFGTEHKKG